MKTASPLTSRFNATGDNYYDIGDSSEHGQGEQSDVLPFLSNPETEEFGEGFMVGAVDSALWDVDDDVQISARSTRGKGRMKEGEDAPRVRAALEVALLGSEAYHIWKEIPEVKEALDLAAPMTENAEQEYDGTRRGSETERKAVKTTNSMKSMAEGEKGDEKKVKEESWESALRTRSQEVRVNAVATQAVENAIEGFDEERSDFPASLNQFHHGMLNFLRSTMSLTLLTGHILTRILSKAVHALHTLHRYLPELHLLTQLLSQRTFRRGRRGRWHEQRLLVLMEYAPKTIATYERAWVCACDALTDEYTHVVWRPKLERRMDTLRKALTRLGSAICGNSVGAHTTLSKAKKISIAGERIHRDDTESVDVVVTSFPIKRKPEVIDDKQMTLHSFAHLAPIAPEPKPARIEVLFTRILFIWSHVLTTYVLGMQASNRQVNLEG